MGLFSKLFEEDSKGIGFEITVNKLRALIKKNEKELTNGEKIEVKTYLLKPGVTPSDTKQWGVIVAELRKDGFFVEETLDNQLRTYHLKLI